MSRMRNEFFEKAMRWQRDSAAIWSEWSECDNSLIRSRRRNCTDCDKREETAPCISDTNFQKEFPAITHELEQDLIPIPKKIAKNFDSAKMLSKSATKIPEDEASLFAENDYENQHEVSYFGPPHKQQQHQQQLQAKEDEVVKNYLLDSGRIEDISKPISSADKSLKIHSMPTKSNNDDNPMIKQMESDETSVAVVEFPEENQQQHQRQNFDGLRLLPPPASPSTTTTTQKPVGKKAVQLSPIEASSSDSSIECNPREDCCPLVDMSNRKHRGCTLGYKINQYNQQEGCVPESCRNKVASEFMF
uniref:Uncharacterized protein n=1 Tax=Panagrolaimus sp. ES5 TaxID=591445 RepID=A0AC34FII5_9BILA